MADTTCEERTADMVADGEAERSTGWRFGDEKIYPTVPPRMVVTVRYPRDFSASDGDFCLKKNKVPKIRKFRNIRLR